ncbi:MAG: ribosomal-protein-alanine acetyltransferase [Thiotrichales bacterium SG8_50]|nr:MAG: ribosomal-protein-alanine acetyltransferase [Thiotrichales bacterium SG8_50]
MSTAVEHMTDGLRPMTAADLDAVMEIEAQAYPFPWTLGIFRDCLHVGYCCWVYSQGEDILAYGVMSIAAGESHLLNLCVRADARRTGLGTTMLRHLVNLARKHGADVALLEVRPSNVAAVDLYRSVGFNEVGIRKNYYPADKGREDALVMARQL